MSGATGRYIPVSYFRRLVTDLMHFSAKVPSATIERHMDLAGLVAARQACAPPPTWSAIFTKAYAVVAARTPVLRTSYLTFPWPRLYEHAANIATAQRRSPARRTSASSSTPTSPVRKLAPSRSSTPSSATTRRTPVESIPSYRQAVRLSRVPWPFRRLLWWAGLNVFGSGALPALRHVRHHLPRLAGCRHNAPDAAADVPASLRHVRCGRGGGDAAVVRSPRPRRGHGGRGTGRHGRRSAW